MQYTYQTELEAALQAALFAGDYFRSRVNCVQTVKIKSSLSDLVTEVDPFCERLIRDTILRRFEEDFILGEESVAPGAKAASEAIKEVTLKPRLWIVDPLDGTNNFISGIPLSVVSIAFSVNGETQIGVVYDPYRQEAFYALQGYGMYVARDFEIRNWLQNTCLDTLPGVKSQVTGCEQFEHAVVATGFPVRGAEKETASVKSLQIAKQVRSFRALGAAALQLAYVAAGRLDLFYEYELNAWDIAAGVLLVHEAGGVIRQIDGSKVTLETRDILTSCSEKLIDEFDAVFRMEN
jgi:myo-inositol-1(or 4)-monophosphatase